MEIDQALAGDEDSEFTTNQNDRPPEISIMDLPVEVRAKIFHAVEQKFIPNARLVCHKWKEEIDKLYEFRITVYGNCNECLNAVYDWRCSVCILKTPASLSYQPIFRYPVHLKKLTVFAPLNSNNLEKLLGDFQNLECLIIMRLNENPWVTDSTAARQTPKLDKLVTLELRYDKFCSNLEVDNSLESTGTCQDLPLMECFFPSLKKFSVLTRAWTKEQSNKDSAAIFMFLTRHVKSLKSLSVQLHPVSHTIRTVFWLNGIRINNQAEHLPNGNQTNLDLNTVRKVRLKNCFLTTQCNTAEARIWKYVLENQNELENFHLNWCRLDTQAEFRERVAGFPWTFLQQPIMKSSEYLVTVSLEGLSMMARTNDGFVRSGIEILRFDMSIFRNCCRLKELTLRCHDGHGQVPFPVPSQAFDEVPIYDEVEFADFVEPEPPEFELAINGCDLPISLKKLEINGLRAFTTDLESIFQKCVNLEVLYLTDIGKEGALGVTGPSVQFIAHLSKLQFLDLVGFNDIVTQDPIWNLQHICDTMQILFEGKDTWIQLDNAGIPAHDSLQLLLEQ